MISLAARPCSFIAWTTSFVVFRIREADWTIDPTVVENYDHVHTEPAPAAAESTTSAVVDETATRVDAPSPEVPAPHDAAATESARARKPR